MKRNIRPDIFALALLFQLTTSLPSPAGTLYPIAISGQPAPDGNGVFATGFAEPTLNNRGVVCFYAIFNGSTGNLASSGICCGIPGLVTQVARKEQLPGVLGGGKFLDMEAASGAINDAGQVAFKSPVTPVMSSNTRAVFRKGAGRDSFSLLARRADPAPGEGTFAGLSDTRWRPVLGSAGHVAFQADLLGTDGGTTDDKGIFRSSATGDSLVRVVQEGEAVPGGDTPVSSLGQPVVNSSGQVAIPVFLGSATLYGAVVRGDGNDLVTIARVGQVVVGFGTVGNLTSRAVSMNDAGKIAFCISKTSTQPEALAVSSGPGNLNLIAVLGSPVPTLTNRQWSFIESAPSINASGQTGYIGQIRSISNPGPIFDVLFLDQTAVAVTGEPLPGGGGIFSSFINMPFALNDSAQFAFRAQITLDGFSGASHGIFFHDGVGGLHEVIRRGRPFLGSTITTVDFAGTVNSVGIPPGMNGLNNAGEVAFRFELADEREGIALWSSLPKPVGGTGDITPIANGFRVRFPGIPGWDYVMERDEDLLAPWEILPTPVRAGADGWIAFDDLGPELPAKRFYRCSEAP